MKKSLSLVLALVLCALTLISAPAEENMAAFPSLGINLPAPENMQELGLDIMANEDLLNLTYRDEQVFTALLIIERMTTADYSLLSANEETMQQLSAIGLRILGENDRYTYLCFAASDYEDPADYFAGVLGADYSTLPEESKEKILAALPVVEDIAAGIGFIPIVREEKFVGAFTTRDLDGNDVTESIFADYDLTVINVWGTFCGPCINEMPALAAWHKELPANVQLIGVISDVYDGYDLSAARKIISDTGVEFVNLLASDSLHPLLSMSQYVPTTYFVDSQGKLVDDPIVGANVDGYKQFVEDYLK